MSYKRAKPYADPADPLAPGVYVTDGTSLFNIVGELPHEPSLRLVEDCSTLEILMVHVDGLRSPGVRRVYAEEIEDPQAAEEHPVADAEHESAATAMSAHAANG